MEDGAGAGKERKEFEGGVLKIGMNYFEAKEKGGEKACGFKTNNLFGTHIVVLSHDLQANGIGGCVKGSKWPTSGNKAKGGCTAIVQLCLSGGIHRIIPKIAAVLTAYSFVMKRHNNIAA